MHQDTARYIMDENEADDLVDMDELRAIQLREEELKQLMQITGYETVQENGQRKIGGPPPNWYGTPPPKGCEVFVGKLPRNVFEQELFQVFSTIGIIYELRLMMDFSGTNRGFAFVTYTTFEDASRAIELLNNYELRPRHHIGVVKSIDNCRLFVGGIPKLKTQEEVRAELERLTEGVAKVIVYSSITDKAKNRGFAFVEYVNHRAASKARRKLIPDRVTLWGKEIAVDWALPESQVDTDIMSRVTVLYVRNLNLATTEQTLRDLFNAASNQSVQKVKMMRDFAFIHFLTRESAQQAMDQLNNIEVNGSRIEITWAKPVKDKDKESPKSQSKSKSPKTPSRKTSLSSVASSTNSAASSSYTPQSPAPLPVTSTPPQMIMLQQTYASMSHMLPLGQSPTWYSPQFPSIYSPPPCFPQRLMLHAGQDQNYLALGRNNRGNEPNVSEHPTHQSETGNRNNNGAVCYVQNRGASTPMNGNYVLPQRDYQNENDMTMSFNGLSLRTSTPTTANQYNMPPPGGVAVGNMNSAYFMNRVNGNAGLNNFRINGQIPTLTNTPALLPNYPMRCSKRIDFN